MTSVIIHGKLGKIFGVNHVFQVKRMSEVVHAINANSPGFKQRVLSDCKTGSDYCYVDPENHNKIYKRPEEFLNSKPPKELHIVPVISGAADPVSQFFIGAILAGATYGTEYAILKAVFYVGVSLMIQGAMGILFPIEMPDEVDRQQESKVDTSSYIFSSMKNNAVQGFPIPLLYGELRVGSNIISTNVISEDLGVPGDAGAEVIEADAGIATSSVGGSSSGGGTSGGTTITIDTDGDGVGDTVINVGGSDGGAAGGGGGDDDSG